MDSVDLKISALITLKFHWVTLQSAVVQTEIQMFRNSCKTLGIVSKQNYGETISIK